MDYKSKIEEVVLNVDLTLRESELLEKEILEIVSLSRKSLLEEVKERVLGMPTIVVRSSGVISGEGLDNTYIKTDDVLTSLEKKE